MTENVPDIPQAKSATNEAPKSSADFTASKQEIVQFSQNDLSPLDHYLVGSTIGVKGQDYNADTVRGLISEAKTAEEKMAAARLFLTPVSITEGVSQRDVVQQVRGTANQQKVYAGGYVIFAPETVALARNWNDPEKAVYVSLKLGELAEDGQASPEWEIELVRPTDKSTITDESVWEKIKLRPKGKDMFGDDDSGEEDMFRLEEHDGKHFVRFIGLE